MQKINEERNDLKKDINEMKSGSVEEMLLIVLYCLRSYFKSLMVFGKDNRVTKDNLNVIKEMFHILRTERKFLNFILKNINLIDPIAAEEVIKMLDDVNDDTVRYYYDVISDIEEAAELEQEFRGYRPRKEYPTLIKENSYGMEVIALCCDIESIKTVLNYEEEFWNYIKSRTKIIDTSSDISSKMARATPITDDGIIVDIEVLAPKINNLQSSIDAIKVYAKAHSIFKKLGSPIDELEEYDDVSEKRKFSEDYLTQKLKQLLKKM